MGPTHKALWTLVTHCLHAIGGKMYFFCSCFTSLRSRTLKPPKRDQKVIGETLLLSSIKLENFKKVELDIIWNPHLNLKKITQILFSAIENSLFIWWKGCKLVHQCHILHTVIFALHDNYFHYSLLKFILVYTSFVMLFFLMYQEKSLLILAFCNTIKNNSHHSILVFFNY